MPTAGDYDFLDERTVAHRFDEVVFEVREAARLGRLAIIGSAGLPQKCAAAIQAAGFQVCCFIEYDPRFWSRTVNGILVVSPGEAARMLGPQGVAIAGVWSPQHNYAATADWARAFGLRRVHPVFAVFWAFADLIGAHYQLGPPDVYATARGRFEGLDTRLADPQSRCLLREHVRWRVTLDPASLPMPDRAHVYFDPRLFSLPEDAAVVDCGAFDGDSLRHFLRWHGEAFRAFHALEPDPVSHERLERYVATLPRHVSSKISVHQVAAGSSAGEIQTSASGMPGSQGQEDRGEGVSVRRDRLDEMLADETIHHLKLDIEGAELDALEGAWSVIARDRPVIAVAVYHRPLDIVDLSSEVIDRTSDYAYFLRSHDDDGIDLTLYAVPLERLPPAIVRSAI